MGVLDWEIDWYGVCGIGWFGGLLVYIYCGFCGFVKVV